MTVHIVEDDPGVRDALSELCRSVGRSVKLYDTCQSFGAGDQVAGGDLVLVDLQLPDATGAEVVRRVRRAPSPARVVVISGLSQVEINQAMRGLDSVTVMRKPLSPEIIKIIL